LLVKRGTASPGSYGMLDLRGKETYPLEFETINGLYNPSQNGRYVRSAKSANGWGAIDALSGHILPADYVGVESSDNQRYVFVSLREPGNADAVYDMKEERFTDTARPEAA
jgi:hypothetical protein